MSLRDMACELSSDYHVQQVQVTNHPKYSKPVRVIRFGWANKNRETVWYKTVIEPLTS